MSVTKRLTVTIDPHLVEAGNEAVAEGRAESLSAWVNLALADRVAKERPLRALGDAIARYEAQFGGITAEEMASQARTDRSTARVVRGATPAARAVRRRSHGVP
jgi:hypothetical protein